MAQPRNQRGVEDDVVGVEGQNAIEAWPRQLARLYGGKESELKARLGEVRKLPFVRSMAIIDL